MSKKISYALLLKKALGITAAVLFAILFVRVVFGLDSTSSVLRESFELELLGKKGPLRSKSFTLYKSNHYYEFELRRRPPRLKNDVLLINIKLIDKDQKIINEFNMDFAKDPSKSYNKMFREKVLKASKTQQLQVVLQVLKNNIDKGRATRYNNQVALTIRNLGGRIATKYYFRVFLYVFFGVIFMLFIPNKTF